MKPIALTMGEPAGIAGEITRKAWLARAAQKLPPFFVLGDPEYLRRDDIPLAVIETPEEAIAVFDKALPVMPIRLARPAMMGIPDPANASIVMKCIEEGVRYCKDGRAAALVTNPVHKGALHKAGFGFPGHTEYLAHLCGISHHPVMMLEAQGVWGCLRVVPLTIHIALKDVAQALTVALIVEKALIVHRALRDLYGIENPRLALAGLNPHAGESGAFGREEEDVLKPALGVLQAGGVIIRGPHPADTLFHAEARQRYDAALCCYHDQALIPLKTLDFAGGVNVTLGLPIVRTSPDHGTALDIAGQGIADAGSLIQAIRRAGT